MSELKKIKQCGFCGKEFKGKNYPIYDENWNKENIERCRKCWEEELNSLEE